MVHNERNKIIIVDDNLANLTMGKEMLKADYAVYPAPSAKKMFEILEKITPHMILLDVDMPEMNGFEAITILKANPKLYDIPVIFLTAANDESSELEGLGLGAIDYIYKPFSAPLLLKRIENHMVKKRSDDANRVKSSFLASMSHELRTPMNAIMGMTELLLNEPLNEQQMDFVNDINTSAQTLLAIINDLLDLSKIEAGKLELNPVDYDFRAFIENVNATITYLAEKKGIDFKYEEKGEIPEILLGDKNRLKQILFNLCGNAVKYTEKGLVCLSVSASGDKLYFEITDTGKGIRKEDLPFIFDVYAQSDTIKNRSVVGIGLGLSLCKTFVEMMEGEITVDSVDGQGSVFKIWIPLNVGGINISKEEVDKKDNPIFAPSANVLVVDDNDLNLKVATWLLSIHKIKAKTATSGQEAIDMVKQNDFDLIFMDHMMPHMDGVVATGIIRKLGDEYSSLPIIALTATAIIGAREMFLANGFDGFLPKPIDVKELHKILLEWLPAEKIIEEKPLAAVTRVIEDVKEDINFISSVRKINQINTGIGLRQFAGIESMYQEALEHFNENLPGKLTKLQEYLNAEDVKNFAIAIHSMKSELATIGAMRLSEMALNMEKAAKDDNISYCEMHFLPLKAMLISINENLSMIFEGRRSLYDEN